MNISHLSTTRSASAIVLTIGMVVLIFAMLGLSSTRLKSMHEMTNYDSGIQQAAAAAEAVTSFRETKLVDLAASNDLADLSRNPDTSMLATDPWEGMEWFGNCIVRWRAEPVIIASEDGRFITNPFLFGVNKEMQDNPDYVENHEYYHFRISAEAHYLRNRNLVDGTNLAALEAAGELPWQRADNKVCTVRATRVVQMKLNSLFKYALFHAKEGPYGDIEIGPGYDQNITGRVHSNGAIYVAGQPGWGAALIGDASDKVDMVGIDGVYRMRKDDFLYQHRFGGAPLQVSKTDPKWGDKVWFGDGNQDPLPVDPDYYVDLSHSINRTSGPSHRLNGIYMSYKADSRSGTRMKDTYGAYMRDSFNSGATVVKTLSNIPQLGGRPFEAQRLFPEGTQMWTINPGNPNDYSSWTILPNEAFRPADWFVDPEGLDADGSNDFDFTTKPGPFSGAVTSYAEKLFHVREPRNRRYATNYSSMNPALGADVDEDGDGRLDNSGAIYDPNTWFVDAGGLKQWYQRKSPGVGNHVVDGRTDLEASLNIIDIFDPAGTYDQHPSPKGPSAASPASKLKPGATGFRYHGPPVADADGDTFGDNEVLGTYINWALNSKDKNEPKSYGLVIRERRYQRIPDASNSDAWAIMPDRPVGTGSGAPPPPPPSGGGGGGSGKNAKITISRYDSSGYWSVDCVDFIRVTDGKVVRVDNKDSDYSEPSGSLSNGTSSRYSPVGGSYRYTSNSGRSSVFEADLDGRYQVRLRYARNTSRKRVRIVISGNDAAGNPFTAPTIVLNQYGSRGGVWATLGTFEFGHTPPPAPPPPSGPPPPPPPPSTTLSTDYAKYLKSQYAVFFGPHEITDLFFDFGAAAASSDEDYVVYERDVLDRREAVFMQYQFWNPDTSKYTGGSEWKNYRVNVLTFNMRKTLDFLMATDFADISGDPLQTGKANARFNGMIYAHRTRRSDSYTPWGTTRWHPDCYGIWNCSVKSKNWELPPSGHLPNHNPASSVYPANGFDWRSGSGPAMSYHSAVRLTNAEDLNYGVYFHDDMGTPDDPTDDYKCKKGLTFITPNMCYVWKDYNTVKYGDSRSGNLGNRATLGSTNWKNDNYKSIPCAIFADYINILSNEWKDSAQTTGSRTKVGKDTWMISSVITNNIPSHVDGTGYIHPSEGSHNLIRYNESWGSSRTFHLKGSNVVMNTRRYSRSHIAYKYDKPNLNNDVYDPPNRDFVMNSDLFTKPGQPPFTPFGVTVTRTIMTIEDLNN